MLIPTKDAKPFMQAWSACNNKTKKGSRIATLPDLAKARIAAPKPHTPGKPWETYYDGTSPLWENWLMTSSCLLLGMRGSDPVVMVVHGLDPEEPRGKNFVFSQATWSLLLTTQPGSQVLAKDLAEASCSARRTNYHSYTSSDMRADPVFRAAFGDELDRYAEAHREIASEYLVIKLGHNDLLDRVEPAHRHLLGDPPIIEFDIDWIQRETVPTEGAIGRYLCLENIQNVSLHDIRHGSTRCCDLGTVGPTDDSKFAIVKL